VGDGAKTYALSNNHVFARVDKADPGEYIVQPGKSRRRHRLGEGCGPAGRRADWIASLHRARDIDCSPSLPDERKFNTVDAAIAETTESCLGTADLTGFEPKKEILTTSEVKARLPSPGLPVRKYGQRSGETFGDLRCIQAKARVSFGGEKAWFADQLVIEGDFSRPGDSGSLVVSAAEDDTCGRPVGLLFARSASGDVSLANPIDEVLCCLGVAIDTEAGLGEVPDPQECGCMHQVRREQSGAGGRDYEALTDE
jgi:hypothetical protein